MPDSPRHCILFRSTCAETRQEIAQLVDKVFKMHSDPRLFSSTPLIGMLRCIVTRAATTNWRNGRLRNIMSNDAQAYLNGSVRGELRGRRRARRQIGDDFISSSCHRRLALAREHAQEETRYNKLTWTDTTKRARNGSTCSTCDDGPDTKTSDIAYLVPYDMDMPTDRCRRYHQWMI